MLENSLSDVNFIYRRQIRRYDSGLEVSQSFKFSNRHKNIKFFNSIVVSLT